MFYLVDIMNIDSIKRCVLIGAVLIGTSLSLPANAEPHRGGHGGGPGWWGIGLGLGLGWEAAHIRDPYYYPAYPVYYYPAPGYYYPVSPPTVMIDSPSAALPPGGPAGIAPPAAQSAPNWYYCDSAKGYYPYVRQCPEPWHMVPATPPGPIR